MELSGKVLVAGNLLAIALAVIFSYDFAMVVWSYWAESAIIGFFTFLSFIYVGKGFLRGREKGKEFAFLWALFFAWFFAVHYGGFHMGYLLFLCTLPLFHVELTDIPFIALSAGILFISHGFSFYQNKIKGREGEPIKITRAAMENISSTFAGPYARIIPIHLTLLAGGLLYGMTSAGGTNAALLVLFMGIKTAIDLKAHEAKHRAAGGL